MSRMRRTRNRTRNANALNTPFFLSFVLSECVSNEKKCIFSLPKLLFCCAVISQLQFCSLASKYSGTCSDFLLAALFHLFLIWRNFTEWMHNKAQYTIVFIYYYYTVYHQRQSSFKIVLFWASGFVVIAVISRIRCFAFFYFLFWIVAGAVTATNVSLVARFVPPPGTSFLSVCNLTKPRAQNGAKKKLRRFSPHWFSVLLLCLIQRPFRLNRGHSVLARFRFRTLHKQIHSVQTAPNGIFANDDGNMCQNQCRLCTDSCVARWSSNEREKFSWCPRGHSKGIY